MPDSGVRSAGAVGLGWVGGLVSYDALTRSMEAAGWLERADPLTPGVYAWWLVALGAAVAGAVALSDVRPARRPVALHHAMRALVAAGVVHVALALYHAHATTDVRILGPSAVLPKDVLFHAPGILLLVVGWNLRPVSGRDRTSPATTPGAGERAVDDDRGTSRTSVEASRERGPR